MLHKTIADVMFNVGFDIPLSQNQYYKLVKEVNRLGGKVLLKGNSTTKEKDDEYSLVAKISRINSKKFAKFCDDNKMYYRCFDATTDKEITKQFKAVGNSNMSYFLNRKTSEVIIASSKKEAIAKIVASKTSKRRLSEDEFKANYKKVFDYCTKIKINPKNEPMDSDEDSDSFTFGVKNDWNTVDIYYNGKFGYSLNNGESYKSNLTFEQLKKVLDKYANDNKNKLGNNKVVTRMFM